MRAGPAPPERAFVDVLDWHANAVEGEFQNYSTDRPPGPEVRRALTTRANELAATLGERARDRRAVAQAVAELMTCYRGAKISAEEAKGFTAKYTEILEDLPAWAVKRACQQVARGAVEGVSLDFPPSAPRLREVVLRITEPFAEEQAKIFRVLRAAPRLPPNPEMAERVKAMTAAWLDRSDPVARQLAEGDSKEREAAKARRTAEIERGNESALRKVGMVGGVTSSLAKMLGAPARRQQQQEAAE